VSRTGRAVAALERHAVGAVAAAAAVTIALVFYLPVGIVLSEAVTVVPGVPPGVSVAPLVAVLTDEFYVGALAGVAADPLAVGRHAGNVLDWAGAFAGGETGLPEFGLFGFTAYQALVSTVASVALGLPGAYVLARFEFPGRRTLRSLTILPFILPSVMVAIGFVATFGRQGLLNTALAAVGLPPVDLIGTLTVVVVAHAFYNAPLVTRVTVAAWEGVDARAVETARSLGAGRRRAFVDVVVPQLLPAVLTGALLTFVFTFMTFPIVLALGGLDLATVEVWVYALLRNLNYEEAAALAVLETAVSLALTYAYLRYEARQAAGNRGANPPDRVRLVPSPRALLSPSRLAVLAYAAVAALVFLGPIVSMVWTSVAGPDGPTLAHYEFLVQRQVEGTAVQTKPWPAVRNSLTFALGTLAVALPMGVAVALVTTREFRGRTVLGAIAMGPIAVSGIVTGVGLLLGPVFGIPLGGGYRLQVTGAVAVVAAHAVAAYPFVTRSVAPPLSRLDPAMVESARALGASRARALLDVELPLVAAGVVAGAAFAFAISVGEFDSTVILAEGSNSYTMPVAVERYRGRRLGPATAMGTVLLVVTSASFVVIDRLGGRFERG